jgi:hypothetical protein
MGSSVDSSFQISSTEASWEEYNHPAIIAVFRNTGSSPTNISSNTVTGQTNTYVPGSQSVASANSLHIIVATRAANLKANGVSGWTQLSNGSASTQSGSTYWNRAHIWYKIGVGAGSSNIGTLSFPSNYGRVNGAQLIFN